jgi:polysaccharide pyruvyl transferase WcaK-like protein
VAYVRKGNDLFERLGLSEQVLNISDIAGADGEERLLEKLTGIHEHRDAVRAAQSKVWAPLESECRSGYAEMIKQVMPGRERDDSIHVGSSSATQDGSTGRVALPLHR